jgi:hypothetical protein
MQLLNVLNGTLHNVIGPARIGEKFKFVPVIMELTGGVSSTAYRLRDATGPFPPEIARLIAQRTDALWVSARIRAEFLIDPSSEAEKTSIDVGFAAAPIQNPTSVLLFSCCDYYLRTGLIFGGGEPAQATRAEIAGDFWRLLLRNPDQTADFEGEMYHPGAGVQMHFACRGGAFEFWETNN